MQITNKQKSAHLDKNIFNIDFHHFLELEGEANHMEIAEELGISLREVQILKKKVQP